MSEAARGNEDLTDLEGLDSESFTNEDAKTKQRNRSNVWSFFEMVPDSDKVGDGKARAKCKMCGATYLAASKYGTGNLKCHIDTCPRRSTRDISELMLGQNNGSILVVASPADHVKVRMQADGCMVSQGRQPRYSGPFDALNKIMRTEGFKGLWKGVFPNVQRANLVNTGELACYDHAKRFVIQNDQITRDNIFAHTLASIMSGLSATALSCPADVVKTRMMNQAAGKEGKIMYTSSYDCLVKTVRIEGLRALWKGFFPTWARLGPWQFVFWVSYEKLRQISGLSSL